MHYRSNNPPGVVCVPQIRIKSGPPPGNSKIYVRLAGFLPRVAITLIIRATTGGSPPEVIWEAEAVFRADDYGMVDVGLQKPLSADTAFVGDPLGLFAMKQFPGHAAGYTIALSALTGGKITATATLKRPPLPKKI